MSDHHTDELIEAVRQGWIAGDSGKVIGSRVGLSRNAIIGLVNRRRQKEGVERWPQRLQKSHDVAAATQRAVKRAAKPREKPKPKPPGKTPRTKTRPPPSFPKPPKPLTRSILWNERRPNQCSFIVDEPNEVHIEALECCGDPVLDGGAWCSYHRSVVYKPDPRAA